MKTNVHLHQLRKEAREETVKKVKIKLILFLIIIIFSIIWIPANKGLVETKFFFKTIETPLYALLTITLLIGMAAGILLSLILLGKKDKKLR